MLPFKKNIVLFFALFAITLILGVGSFRPNFPTLNLVFINLIFLSLLFQNRKVTLLTGLGMAILYSLVWLTPMLKPEMPNTIPIYIGTLFLLFVCTGISLLILDINNKTSQGLKHFFLLYEYATEGILIVDDRGKILMGNPTICKMFGYDEKEILNQPIEILIPAKNRENHPHYRMSYMKKPTNREMGKGRDLSGLRKNGEEFPVEISLSSYEEKGQTFVIGFIIDITIRKLNERQIIDTNETLEKMSSELRILNEDLEKKVDERTQVLTNTLKDLEVSRMELKEALKKEMELNEIKGRFVSMASHEFRTPLSTVLSSSSLIEKYKLEEEQEKREKHTHKIKESVRHLNNILEDFLSLGKLDENKITIHKNRENIQDIIFEVMQEMHNIKKVGQNLSFVYEASKEGIIDKNLLINICFNLLSNAIKFSPENGSIELKCIEENKRLKLTVKDNGIGIPQEDMQNLFSSFFRSQNAFNIQGTGLGLHIVKRYVELLEGDIKIESELNQGTEVIILLPY